MADHTHNEGFDGNCPHCANVMALHQELAILLEKYRHTMRPFDFVMTLATFAALTAFDSAPSLEEAQEELIEAIKNAREFIQENTNHPIIRGLH